MEQVNIPLLGMGTSCGNPWGARWQPLQLECKHRSFCLNLCQLTTHASAIRMSNVVAGLPLPPKTGSNSILLLPIVSQPPALVWESDRYLLGEQMQLMTSYVCSSIMGRWGCLRMSISLWALSLMDIISPCMIRGRNINSGKPHYWVQKKPASSLRQVAGYLVKSIHHLIPSGQKGLREQQSPHHYTLALVLKAIFTTGTSAKINQTLQLRLVSFASWRNRKASMTRDRGLYNHGTEHTPLAIRLSFVHFMYD